MSALALAVLALLIGRSAQAAEQPRRASVDIQDRRVEWNVHVGGTLDGRRTLDPVVSAAPRLAYEPMRVVRLENMGEVDLVNPWLQVNDRGDWRTLAGIVDAALRGFGEPARLTEAERARAVYEFVRQNRFHATSGDLEVRDPVKMFNIYGYGLCGDTAPVLAAMMRQAGLSVRRGFPTGHCTTEVFYDGAWHLFDADESTIFLDRDNATIAGEEQLTRDHELAKRAADEQTAALYSFAGSRAGGFPSGPGHTMQYHLRPGEAIEWRWAGQGKHHYAAVPQFALKSAHLKRWGAPAWARLANGTWSYTPRLRGASVQGGSQTLTWKMQVPYVIVGGAVRAQVTTVGGGGVRFSVSFDGEHWQDAGVATTGPWQTSLDRFFPEQGSARYGYFLRADIEAKASGQMARLDSVEIRNDLQMAPLSLPSLEIGLNRLLYTDESESGGRARLTLEWVESDTLLRPAAPRAPLQPVDGADIEGTSPRFRWQAAEPAGAVPISGYHFQLSPDSSMRVPLSSAFDRVTGKPEFEPGRAGMLTPGRKYWWRVRARSDQGVWGEWSRAWTFVPNGPGMPEQVKMIPRGAAGFRLVWRANTEGRRPVRFDIYAADEQGFTPSDNPYRIHTGNQKARGLFPGKEQVEMPPNLLSEATAPYLDLAPRHAFYRVVAIDERGNRSGASDFAEAPRPFIHTQAPTAAQVGIPYGYQAKTIRSIGHLTTRDFPPEEWYQYAFWEADQPRFALLTELGRCGNGDARWLTIDSATGVLSGTPAQADEGLYQINIQVEIPGVGRHVQSFPLAVARKAAQ